VDLFFWSFFSLSGFGIFFSVLNFHPCPSPYLPPFSASLTPLPPWIRAVDFCPMNRRSFAPPQALIPLLLFWFIFFSLSFHIYGLLFPIPTFPPFLLGSLKASPHVLLSPFPPFLWRLLYFPRLYPWETFFPGLPLSLSYGFFPHPFFTIPFNQARPPFFLPSNYGFLYLHPTVFLTFFLIFLFFVITKIFSS